MSAGFIPKEKLTAYQRWELAAFDEAEQKAEAAQETADEAVTPHEEVAVPPEPEAPPIILPTAADIERMHNEAHEQGYAAGYAEGIADAHAVLADAREIVDSLQQAMTQLDQQVADQLLATAIEIAGQVLRQSLKLKPELLLPIVREAVAALQPGSGHPALLAHPEDAELIRTHMGDHLSHNGWRIIEDPSITRGGCRIELGASEVDATLETRWRRVIEAIGITEDWLSDKP